MMKKITLILFLCSIVMIALGLVLGASTCIYWDASGMRLAESVPYHKQASEPFDKIRVDASTSDMEIVYGDEFAVEYYTGDNNPTISLDDDTLVITQEPRRFYMSFGFSLFRMDTIKITVPHGTKLKGGNIRMANGQAKIIGQNFDSLTVSTDNGRVVLAQTDAVYADISCGNGDIRLTDVSSNYLGVSFDNGNISGENVKASRVSFTANNGNVNLQGVDWDGGVIDVENGNVDVGGAIRGLDTRLENGRVKLSIVRSDAYFHLLCRNGSVSFDKSRKGSFWESGDRQSSAAIRADVENGAITVEMQ